MSTKLGGILKNGAPKSDAEKYSPNAISAKPTLLGVRIADGRRGMTTVVPELGEMRLELLGTRETQEVEAAMYRNMAALGIELNGITAERYELERAVLTLSRSARDPADKSAAFGTEQEWQALDPRLINAAWVRYGDVKEELDPHAEGLGDDERVLIESALKKKDAQLLRSFGVVKLCAYMLSTDAPPSTSPQVSSSNSESGSAP